jgi:hypothetical protein
MPPMNEDERPPRAAEDPSDDPSRDGASAERSERVSSEASTNTSEESAGASEESASDESPTDESPNEESVSAQATEASEESATDESPNDESVGVQATEASEESASDESPNDESVGVQATDASEERTSTSTDSPDEAESTPPREETAAALEAEAVAAREAVTEASKPEPPRYPPPDARTQKLAGWGCVFLLIALTFGFVVVFRVAFMRLTALDTNMNGYEITTGPAEATRRPDREPETGSHSTAPEGGGVAWRTDLEAAFREARRTERPLLLHFEARWAMASRDMLEGTYANVTVREALGSFVPVRIDLTERDASEEELVRRYRVEGLPHVVYIAPEGYRLRPDSKTLVDASDMEVFLQEALGAWQDGRRYDEPVPAEEANEPGVTGANDSNAPNANEP